MRSILRGWPGVRSPARSCHGDGRGLDGGRVRNPDGGVRVVLVERLALEQRVRERVELLAVPGQDAERALVALVADPAHLGIEKGGLPPSRY